MDPNTSDMSLAEMDYKGAFSKGKYFSLPVECLTDLEDC